jgi:hypothetical protein
VGPSHQSLTSNSGVCSDVLVRTAATRHLAGEAVAGVCPSAGMSLSTLTRWACSHNCNESHTLGVEGVAYISPGSSCSVRLDTTGQAIPTPWSQLNRVAAR